MKRFFYTSMVPGQQTVEAAELDDAQFAREAVPATALIGHISRARYHDGKYCLWVTFRLQNGNQANAVIPVYRRYRERDEVEICYAASDPRFAALAGESLRHEKRRWLLFYGILGAMALVGCLVAVLAALGIG